MTGLASRWADDPELVEAATKQDSTKTKPSPLKSNAVTSVRGKPLASKWADSSDDEVSEKTVPKPQPNHRSPPKEPKKYRDSPKRHGKQDLSSTFGKKLNINDDQELDSRQKLTHSAKEFADRLGLPSNDQSSIPKTKFNKHNKSKHADEEDPWEDQDEEDQAGDVEEEEEYAPEPPTEAGNSLASRLGLGSTSPVKSKQPNKAYTRSKREQERERLRDERVQSNREWDHNKEPSHHRGSNDHRQSRHHKDNRNEYKSHHQNQHKHHPHGNRDKQRDFEAGPNSEPETRQLTEEELAKYAEESRKVDELLASGNNDIDWADF